jgi:hypothetical protein
LIIDSKTTSFFYDTACFSYVSPSGKTLISGGLYQDTILNKKGCDSLISIFLTIQPNNNSSASINISTCENYTSPSNRVYTQTGTYKDTLANSLGCDSIITINLTIDTLNKGVIQVGNSLIANQNNVKYQWLDCSNNFAILLNDTNQNFSSVSSGSYAVKLRNACIDTSSCVNLTIVGLNEIYEEKELTIAPNPSNGYLTLSAIFNIDEIQIYAINGEKIQSILNPKNELNLTYLPDGIFFLNAIGTDYSVFKKIIIKK